MEIELIKKAVASQTWLSIPIDQRSAWTRVALLRVLSSLGHHVQADALGSTSLSDLSLDSLSFHEFAMEWEDVTTLLCDLAHADLTGSLADFAQFLAGHGLPAPHRLSASNQDLLI